MLLLLLLLLRILSLLFAILMAQDYFLLKQGLGAAGSAKITYFSRVNSVFLFLQFSLTSLHLAAWYGHKSVVKLLLQYGADVNAVDRVS